MSNPSNQRPTESELTILQILWEKGPSSVREVHDLLSRKRDTGYTTTLKLMQIMAEKGLVRRDTSQRTHIYESAVREKEVQDQLLQRFVSTTFKGSAMKLVMQALGNSRASKKELEDIRALLDEMESRSKPEDPKN